MSTSENFHFIFNETDSQLFSLKFCMIDLLNEFLDSDLDSNVCRVSLINLIKIFLETSICYPPQCDF